MKKYLLFILPLLAFVACNDDDDDYSLDKYWIDIATVENPDNEGYFFFRLDDNTLMWTAATNYPNYRPRTGQRIIANYTILNDQPDNSRYDHDVKLNDAYNILTKNIFHITPATQDSIGNDPIGLRDMWIGRDYLNVRFYYNGSNRIHYINLVKDDAKEYTDGKIHLELRHNANNDGTQYRYNGIVSFNLESLVQESIVTSRSIDLVIHVREYPGEHKIYNLTYNFTDGNDTVKDFDLDDFDDGKQMNIE